MRRALSHLAMIILMLMVSVTNTGIASAAGAITDLIGVALTNEPSVMLYWSAPQDFDAAGYTLAYSVVPITDVNWEQVSKIDVPKQIYSSTGPYSQIKNLSLGANYFFAIKAYDSNKIPGVLSNIASAKTTGSVKSWNFRNLEEMTSNSWWNSNPKLPPGSTSQVFLTYDTFSDLAITWGGHLYGGGYPQLDEIYTYDMNNLALSNSWSLEDIKLANTSDIPNGGCSTSGNYDDANNVLVKIAQSPRQDFEYWRGDTFEGWPWVYDFSEHKWFDMKAFNFREWVGYAVNGTGHIYNSDDQYHMIVDPRNNAVYKNMFYDAYTNKFFRMQCFDNTELVSTRNDVGIVWDTKRKRFLAVGGSLQRDVAYNDVWEFSFGQSKWVKVEGVTNCEIIPTFRSDASAAVYDSLHDKVILFDLIGRDLNYDDSRIILTFIYDPETRTWSRGNDKPGFASSHRLMDLNAIFSEKHNTALVLDSGNTGFGKPSGNATETWTYRYSDIMPSQRQMEPPQNISLQTRETSVNLAWGPTVNAATYNIYKAQAENPWEAKYSKVASLSSTQTSYLDTSVIPGKIYFYYLTVTDSTGKESKPSLKYRTQPRVLRDGYVAVLSRNQTKITWVPRTEDKDVVGYNLYRALVSVDLYPIGQLLNYPLEVAQYNRPTIRSISDAEGNYTKINSNLIATNQYLDNIDLAADPSSTYPYKVYAYRVKAVNRFGVEGGWSPYWLTIPNPPTKLVVTFDDNNYYLSWTPPHNCEAIQGYRIYRVKSATNGREEITTDVLKDTQFVVPKTINGNFFISAVDVLGQEGIPSAGAWGERPFSNFYKQYYQFSISTYFLPEAVEALDYNFSFQVVNGTPPFNWKVISGALPAGFSLGADGKIFGTANQAGTYKFTVGVTDAAALTATRDLSLTVEPALTPPVAEAGGPYKGQVNVPLTLDASGSYDVDGTILSYEWDLDNNGTWDVSTKQSKLTVTWPSAYSGSVKLRVTDDDGLTSMDTASVTVTKPAVRGDLNGDGKVDYSDYLILMKAMNKCKGQAGYNPNADYNGDGCVDLRDYSIWYGYYRTR